MQLDVSGHHVDVSESLKDYVKTKFSRLRRHFDTATHAHVILSVEKLAQKAEATVHVSGGNLFADAVEEDMYAAIDALADKLDRQLKRHKEKLTSHYRSARGSKAVTKGS
ncbi:MAG: ribosome-associated translation inhibitor RaiA [Gammaproteobacteria bacterium]|nr:ribosome-associated translation inhibitor RaiA [Gammaproteobacteria bacterium]NIM72204.1 ribosome-associated translation inhibitor RaiA [Gammaproteobacteria bacterium]NIN39119.1 ribosome-associated translation inhibitor RaiA [Gammaproteobacteria bacterium]NIO23952.1 ribosome-associated translation inhibitor RaiA [Gammaproteobacteria bacterium]NIO64604.1 ribosome-associated translation inhibitor RaiA [Gammaproteobacteria bacterium]